MYNQLIEQSVEQSSFSSNTHVIEVTTQNSKLESPKKYPIPDRYNKNQLVLLPINKQKFYFYWEFTVDFLNQNKLQYFDEIKFIIVDEENNTLKEIDNKAQVGEYFVNDLEYSTKIAVVVGYYFNELFVEVMRSKTIGGFNTQIQYNEKDGLVYLKKQKGFTEIIKSSMDQSGSGLSSASYIKEIQRFQEFTKLSQDTLSSHTLREK